MTTIKPRLGSINLDVKHVDSEGYALIQIGDLPKQVPGMRTVSVAARYPVADILAALDAVPAEDATRWQTAAEENERWADALKDRAEKVEADHAATKKAYRDLGASHAKLLEQRDALAATVERVRETAEAAKTWGWQWKVKDFAEQIEKHLAALDPKPAFVLPTEAGARFTATHKGTGSRNEFKTYSDGIEAVYVLHEGTYWVAEDVMSGFEDFRLLGADE